MHLRVKLLSSAAAIALNVVPTSAWSQPRRAINLLSNPPGATVRVDVATAPPLGQTPIHHAMIPQGPHRLLFDLPGYVPASLDVTIARHNHRPAAVTLVQAGSVYVVADVNGAAILVDGTQVGVTPGRINNVPPGPHAIEVLTPGREPVRQTVNVTSGGLTPVNVSLRPSAPATPPPGVTTASTEVTATGTAAVGECRQVCMPGETRSATGCCVETSPSGVSSQAAPDATIGCERGQSRNPDTSGHCCWPNQIWGGDRCRGIPTCPASFQANAGAEACELVPCPVGRVRQGEGLACCWPGQAASGMTCRGVPACPAGLSAQGEECVAPPAPQALPPGPVLTIGLRSDDDHGHTYGVAVQTANGVSRCPAEVNYLRSCTLSNIPFGRVRLLVTGSAEFTEDVDYAPGRPTVSFRSWRGLPQDDSRATWVTVGAFSLLFSLPTIVLGAALNDVSVAGRIGAIGGGALVLGLGALPFVWARHEVTTSLPSGQAAFRRPTGLQWRGLAGGISPAGTPFVGSTFSF